MSQFFVLALHPLFWVLCDNSFSSFFAERLLCRGLSCNPDRPAPIPPPLRNAASARSRSVRFEFWRSGCKSQIQYTRGGALRLPSLLFSLTKERPARTHGHMPFRYHCLSRPASLST